MSNGVPITSGKRFRDFPRSYGSWLGLAICGRATDSTQIYNFVIGMRTALVTEDGTTQNMKIVRRVGGDVPNLDYAVM